MMKSEGLNAEIAKLRQSNPLGGKKSIRSLSNWMFDISDELIPVNFDINEVNKAIINKQIK